MRGFGPVPLTDDDGNDEGLEGIGVTGESLSDVKKDIQALQKEGYRVGSPLQMRELGYWSAVMVRERSQ